MDIVEAATRGDIVLLLAIGVVVLGGAVSFLFHLIIKELRARVDRAESLTDKANDTNDKMADAFGRLEDTTRAAVEELRRR
jgi:uncharacterized protein YdcH (DUF465 family)